MQNVCNSFAFSVIRHFHLRALPLDLHRARVQRMDASFGAAEVLHWHLYHPHRVAGHHGRSLPWLRCCANGKRHAVIWGKTQYHT